jgi:hypothetical protein
MWSHEADCTIQLARVKLISQKTSIDVFVLLLLLLLPMMIAMMMMVRVMREY